MNGIMAAPLKTSIASRVIAQDLLSLDSIQFSVNEPFTWVSGIKSPIYCDNRRVNSDVKVRHKIAEAFVELIQEHFKKKVDIIAGVATGGMPMGTLIADRLGLPFIYVRQEAKEHGLKRQVEGAFKHGDKVVLIEDHISTGNSSIKAAQGLRNVGLEVLALISIMTYGFKKTIDSFNVNHINHYSLCDLDTILDVAVKTGRITEEEKDKILKFRDTQ